MRKVLSFILCLAVIVSAISGFVAYASAEESNVTLPEFTFPNSTYQRFEETGIPYDEIIEQFPENIEIKYENGALLVEDIGAEEVYFLDWLNYDFHYGEYADGYWRFDITLEMYNAGGSVDMNDGLRSWDVAYDLDGKRGTVVVEGEKNNLSRMIMLYPEEGYGEGCVSVSFGLYSGAEVRNEYFEGVLEKQRVALHRETNSMWAEYSADGILQNVEVYVVDSDQHAYFIPGKGWFENEYDETPVDAPDGFENVTEESLKALLPTDIGCEHQWSDPLCDVTSICSKCLRNKGEVLGHTWTSHKEYDICSTCNGILYHSPEAAMPSFNGRPELTLKKLGISIDKIAEKFPEKIITKYENGIFMVPNIDEYYFMARKNSGVYIYTHATNGWNRFEIEEEEVAQLQLRFDGGEDIGGKGYEYTLYYNSEGSLVSVRLESEDPQRKIRIYFEENRVEVTYTNADNNTVEYIDTYLNGNLTSQTVYDNEERIDVYYDSDLKVEKVGAYIDNKTLYYVPNMGWFADRECTKGIATPQGYEEKDAEYFREAYPSNIDFCIHEWNTVHGREECIKCGEKAPLWENKIFKGVIIGVVAAVIAAGAAFITVKRKRAVKK